MTRSKDDFEKGAAGPSDADRAYDSLKLRHAHHRYEPESYRADFHKFISNHLTALDVDQDIRLIEEYLKNPQDADAFPKRHIRPPSVNYKDYYRAGRNFGGDPKLAQIIAALDEATINNAPIIPKHEIEVLRRNEQVQQFKEKTELGFKTALSNFYRETTDALLNGKSEMRDPLTQHAYNWISETFVHGRAVNDKILHVLETLYIFGYQKVNGANVQESLRASQSFVDRKHPEFELGFKIIGP